MTKIGFIGLGRMGKSMALNLARKGFQLAVYDINDAPMQAFTEFNTCRQATDVNDAVKDAEIAITVLPGPPELEAVGLAPDGLIDSLHDGAIFMDQSTVLPETSDRLATAAQARGCHFVDAPIGRLASHADAGECLFMVGAEDHVFQRVKPALEAMGTTCYWEAQGMMF